MAMKLTVIGSSPAWPNPGSAHAGYLVEADGAGRLLLDCGPGVLSRLRLAGLLPVDAIAITHLHLDHWGDLVPWAWMTLHGRELPHPELWMPPGAPGELREFGSRFGQAAMFENAFTVREYEPRTPFQAAGLAVEAVPVQHYDIPAFGFRVRDATGSTLVYSGDTGPCDELAELASDADLFLCEATLASGAHDSTPRGHLSADEALAVRNGRVLLTHRPDELDVPAAAERAHDGLVAVI